MNEKLHHIFMNILKNKQFGNIIVAISKLDITLKKISRGGISEWAFAYSYF